MSDLPPRPDEAEWMLRVADQVRRDHTFKTFRCDRCGAINPDYLSFGVGFPTRRTYCLHHIPWHIRLKMWLKERLHGE
jgi:hypothetical protein